MFSNTVVQQLQQQPIKMLVKTFILSNVTESSINFGFNLKGKLLFVIFYSLQ